MTKSQEISRRIIEKATSIGERDSLPITSVSVIKEAFDFVLGAGSYCSCSNWQCVRDCRTSTAVPMTKSDFITDDELRARGVSELDIDALDRDPATQKFANFSRDREAVEELLRTRRSGK